MLKWDVYVDGTRIDTVELNSDQVGGFRKALVQFAPEMKIQIKLATRYFLLLPAAVTTQEANDEQ